MRQVRRRGRRQQRQSILAAPELKYRQEVVAAFVFATRTPGIKQKGAKRQGAKAVKKLEALPVGTTILEPKDATNVRALAARGNDLAQDRPDIAFACKELCREFAVPNARSFEKLKRVGRYCMKAPRMVYKYDWQECTDNVLDVYVDTDFAGCVVTRRSTNGGVIMNGGHCLNHCNTTQSTIALSSGEAELHGISKGFSHALGIQAPARDLGFDYKIRVHSDAAAAIGIARRRGLGRIRHLDVEDLWVQDCLRQGRVAFRMIPRFGRDITPQTKRCTLGFYPL